MFTFDILSSVCSFGRRDASKNKTTHPKRESHAPQKTREILAFPRPSGHFGSPRRLAGGRLWNEGTGGEMKGGTGGKRRKGKWREEMAWAGNNRT